MKTVGYITNSNMLCDYCVNTDSCSTYQKDHQNGGCFLGKPMTEVIPTIRDPKDLKSCLDCGF